MLIFATHHCAMPLPPAHRFPMPKYARLAERVAGRAAGRMRIPDPATDAELARVHCPAYVAAVVGGTLGTGALRQIGFPWSTALVERSRRSAGATIAACRAALRAGCGVNLAGGTHHAHRDRGAGFCVFNDAAVAIRAMQAEGHIARALVVDLDVHQGDGTAALFAGDPDVFTFSMHGRGNFPFRKATSNLDIELADDTGDELAVGATAERGVEVDEMDPLRSVALPLQGRVERLAVVRLGTGVALHEPNGTTVGHVNRGEECERHPSSLASPSTRAATRS
jgi:acetoin utilization deacetylase AcuC-like enzyme